MTASPSSLRVAGVVVLALASGLACTPIVSGHPSAEAGGSGSS